MSPRTSAPAVLLTTPTDTPTASNAKQMPAAVLEALAEVCERFGGLGAVEAQQLLKEMQQHRRLQMETWA